MASLLVGCREQTGVEPEPLQTLANKTAPRAENPAQCAGTSKDITGPYWREGIPIRSDFDLYGQRGHKLTLSGKVRGEDCEPLANAVIEMWHASPTLLPANALSRTDSVGYDTSSPRFRYYGQFATDANGEYTMSTLKPGWYLNGATFRPSHIHVKVYVDGIERLTTQLYFQGDPFIPGDPWASAAPERAVTLVANDNGPLAGQFDFTV